MRCERSVVYTSIDLFSMDVMVAELIDFVFLHTLTNMRQLGLNSSGQMRGFGLGLMLV